MGELPGEILESSERSLTVRDVEAELDAIAARYRAAGHFGMRLLNALGGQGEDLMRRMPRPVRSAIEGAVLQALHLSVRGAALSRRVLPDQPAQTNRWVSTTMGMVGGARPGCRAHWWSCLQQRPF